jgi:hypothetical protein
MTHSGLNATFEIAANQHPGWMRPFVAVAHPIKKVVAVAPVKPR